MKWIIVFYGVCVLSSYGCSMREREKELEKKMTTVNQKEQELLLKEKSLQLKEDELLKKEKIIDSTLSSRKNDTGSLRNPALVGLWSVKMNCVETNCAGSAVGDIKTEQWEISYQDNTVIAKAMSGKSLVRVYAGRGTGNKLELTAQLDGSVAGQTASMIVRLTETRDNEMEGTREILRADNCKIVYALELKRK